MNNIGLGRSKQYRPYIHGYVAFNRYPYEVDSYYADMGRYPYEIDRYYTDRGRYPPVITYITSTVVIYVITGGED